MLMKRFGIAQSVEHQTYNRKVTGSSPGIGSVCHINFPIQKLVCWCQDNGTSCHEMTNGQSDITPQGPTLTNARPSETSRIFSWTSKKYEAHARSGKLKKKLKEFCTYSPMYRLNNCTSLELVFIFKIVSSNQE